MRRGQVSDAKVQAMTRVATPANEQTLLDVAMSGTASQVERFTPAWRRVVEAKAGQDDASRHVRREFSMLVDDDGRCVVRGRLTPEVGPCSSAGSKPRRIDSSRTPARRHGRQRWRRK